MRSHVPQRQQPQAGGFSVLRVHLGGGEEGVGAVGQADDEEQHLRAGGQGVGRVERGRDPAAGMPPARPADAQLRGARGGMARVYWGVLTLMGPVDSAAVTPHTMVPMSDTSRRIVRGL
jgi:hypothetical protein